MTSLNVNGLTHLTYLDCFENFLTSLDVNTCTALNMLDCRINKLRYLELDQLTSLDGLWAENNELMAVKFPSKNITECIVGAQVVNLWLEGTEGAPVVDLSQYDFVDVNKVEPIMSCTKEGNNLTLTGELDIANRQYMALYAYRYDGNNTNKDFGIVLCVKKKLSSITLNKTNATLLVGEKVGLIGTLAPTDAYEIVGDWRSANTDVATVDINGNVTAKARGTTTIRYSSNYDEKLYAECTIDVVTPEDKITETNFPDEKFRSYVLEKIDTNQDGYLSQVEKDAVTKISIRWPKVRMKSMKGIENFVNLKELEVQSNDLTSLDLSNNPNLEILDCSENLFTTIDLSKNTKLKELDCMRGKLTSLDLSKNTELESIQCFANPLTELDVSHNKKLQDLSLNGAISSIDVSMLSELRSLSIEESDITTLDVSNNPKLIYLNCAVTKLTSLNLSNNKELKYLDCSQTSLQALDLSENTKLLDVECYSSKITELKLADEMPALRMLDCGDNDIESIDVTGYPTLKSLFVGANNLEKIDVTNNTELETLWCNENAITTLDVTNNSKLIELDCGDNQLTTLDVSKNPLLTSLCCYTNALTTLDVTKNPELKEFVCGDNQLTTLDISKNLALEYLCCSKNAIKSLDVTKYTGLKYLECAECQLTSLDVTKNVLLEGLECDDNQLTKLNVTKCTELEYLACGGNNLTELDLSKTPIFQVDAADCYISKVTLCDGVSYLDLSENLLSEEAIATLESTYPSTSFTTDNQIDRNSGTWAYVTRLYSKCLSRTPVDEEVVYWDKYFRRKDEKGNSYKTGAEVAAFFVFSEEYTKKNVSDEVFIKMLYEVMMNRTADAGGIKYWQSVLDGGLSRQYVFKSFVDSQEFTKVCASYGIVKGTYNVSQVRDRYPKVANYVSRIYSQALGRRGDEEGINYWVTAIVTKKITPVAAAENFILSQEFEKKNLNNTEYVKVLYRTFMGREADAAGLNYWVNRLNQGESRKTVLRSFASCQEFKKIVASFGL